MSQGNLPILVLEDSPTDFEAIVRGFSRAGVGNPVYRFSYGEDGLNFLQHGSGRFFRHQSGTRPAFLLLDLNLPGTDGIEVLKAVRSDEHLKTIPVVILSTSSSRRDIEACYEAGANAYMVKPSEPAEFYEAIRRLKEFWLETVTLPARPDTADGVAPPASRAPGSGSTV